MSDPVAIAAQLKQRAAAVQPNAPKLSIPSNIPWYLRDKQEWSLYEDKSENPQQKLNVKAAGAAVVLVAMYFTGHIQRAYERSEGDGSIPMLSSFLIFMSLSIMSKCFTMHVRLWVASAKIRLDAKRKARAEQDAADAAADSASAAADAQGSHTAAGSGGGAGVRKRAGKTKKT